jgi:hypothetical protein
MNTEFFISGSARDSRADFGDLAEIFPVNISCVGKLQQVAGESPATARESRALPNPKD